LPSHELVGVVGNAVTREFCPDGYLRAKEALERAARTWFAEQIAAFNSAAAGEAAISQPPKDVALTPVEELAYALRPALAISEALRQQIMDVLTRTEHRLRNFLHQRVLTAYYFGGLFDQGQHAVPREFWATTDADGVLLADRYWPLGRPRALYEQRRSYPLYVLESELSTLLSDEAEPSLRSLDLPTALAGARSEQTDKPARAAADAKSRPGAKSRGIAEAIKKLWPNGLPKGLSAKDRNNEIIKWLTDARYSLPTNPERAIQRVLKLRKVRQ
jgi:hypothetical protein